MRKLAYGHVKQQIPRVFALTRYEHICKIMCTSNGSEIIWAASMRANNHRVGKTKNVQSEEGASSVADISQFRTPDRDKPISLKRADNYLSECINFNRVDLTFEARDWFKRKKLPSCKTKPGQRFTLRADDYAVPIVMYELRDFIDCRINIKHIPSTWLPYEEMARNHRHAIIARIAAILLFSLFRNVLHDELNYKSYIFLWRNVSNIQWQYHIQARHRTKKVITPHAMPIIKGSLRPRNIKHDEFFQAEVASLLFADRWNCPLQAYGAFRSSSMAMSFFPLLSGYSRVVMNVLWLSMS